MDSRRDQAQRLKRFLDNLPPDSATQAAIDFGVDIDLLARNLLLTPTERVQMVATMSNLVATLQQGIRVGAKRNGK